MTATALPACAGHPEPLWDAHVDGEDEAEQVIRHVRALRICRRCPAVDWCGATVDPTVDDGVRAGRILPTIHDSDRRSPYPGGIPPEREGRVAVGDPALKKCDECNRTMVPKSLRRHWRTVHAGRTVAA